MIITIKPLTKGLQPVYLGFFAIERFQTTILMGPATARPEHGYMASIRQMVSELLIRGGVYSSLKVEPDNAYWLLLLDCFCIAGGVSKRK